MTGKIVADISMSLDGFVTGPDPDLDHGLGRGGEPLHAWAIESESDVDGLTTQLVQESVRVSPLATHLTYRLQ